MRVISEELGNRLTSEQSPKLVLVNGDEPLLVEEALDVLRTHLRSQGVTERIKYQLEAGFDWQLLLGAGQSMSLFSQRRLLELRVPKSLGTAGIKAITEYCDNLPEDDVLIVIMPWLDKRQRNAKWCKQIDFIGWLVDVPSIGDNAFEAWLKKRLQSRALRVEAGVVEFMTSQLEGNVLAAAQEVDKLRVLANDGAVTLKLVTDSMADQARFDVFALNDAMLNGDYTRFTRVAQRLQAEGIEPVIVVWALVRELRTLSMLSHGLLMGESRQALFREHRIWSKRESAINAALNRLNYQQWSRLLVCAAHLDQTVKGQRYTEPGSIWDQISNLGARCCAVPLAISA